MNSNNNTNTEKAPLWFIIPAAILSILIIISALLVRHVIMDNYFNVCSESTVSYIAETYDYRRMYERYLERTVMGERTDPELVATAEYWNNAFMARALYGTPDAAKYTMKALSYVPEMGVYSYLRTYMDEMLENKP